MRRKVMGVWMLAVWAVGCGRPEVSSAPSGDTFGMDFQSWCADWGLQCEPNPTTDGISADKFSAGLAIQGALLDGPSQMNLNKELVSHPDLKAVLSRVGLDAALGGLINQLETSGFESLEVSGGRGYADVSFSDPQPVQGANGMWVSPASEVQLGGSEEGALTLTGLSFASADQQKQGSLSSLLPDGKGLMTMQGADLSVSGVPLEFFPPALGIDLAQIPDDFDTNAVLGSLPALTNVLFASSHAIQLDQNFWSVVMTHLDTLMDDSPLRTNMHVFANSLDQLAVSVVEDSHGEVRANLKGKQTLACKSDGRQAVAIKLDNAFGVESIERLDDEAIRLTFFGAKVKARIFGPIAPTITLKRVDVYVDKVIVRDVPVVGSHTIDLSTPSSGNDDVGAFVCSSL